MSHTSHAGPGDKELMKLGSLGPAPSKSPDHALVKTKGGGLGGAGRKTQEDRARSAHEQAAKDDDCTPEMTKANTPGPETAEVKPKATLKKVGWRAEKTTFKSDAEVYADFDIPPTIADKTLVDFELFRKENGEFKTIKKVQAHVDASGRANAVLPVPASEEPKATFAIKVKHCSAEWSSGQGTEREVTETAAISIEHTQVSGIHFQKGKSFLADIYLNTLCEVKKTYLEWKKTHDKAQIVVYGHTENDEQENPIALGRNRAMSAFLFIIGDVEGWANLAEKERWGVWEQQCMLRALGFFKVKPTGNLGPVTRKAIQDFIAFLNEARCKSINPMLGLSEAYIRKELYREYMNLKRSEIELPSSAFRLVAGYPYVGCCFYNRYKADLETHDENRRIVFVLLQESPNFPATFPCRSSTAGPCETESKKPGERAIKGFTCKFYDEMVKQEKVGNTVAPTGDGVILTEEELKSVSGASDALVQLYQPHLNQEMKAKEISTPLKKSHFLAQLCIESGSLKYAEELASGVDYEGRADLGNTETGDGKKFKGRGLIQITGRTNYTAFGKYCGEDFITGSNHKKVAEPKHAVLSAIWYWSSRSLNQHAEDDEFLNICYRVNGGFNHVKERATYLKKGYEVFKIPDAKARLDKIISAISKNLDKVLPLVKKAMADDSDLGTASAAAKKLSKEKKISHFEKMLFLAVDSQSKIDAFKTALGL